jgi:hypothetical protein
VYAKGVRQFARQRPFVPFPLFISDGSFYDVRHPELVMMGKTSVAVGITLSPEETDYDRLATVDLHHVTRIEPLPAGIPTSGNGAKS